MQSVNGNRTTILHSVIFPCTHYSPEGDGLNISALDNEMIEDEGL
jgi:hypothetical protein